MNITSIFLKKPVLAIVINTMITIFGMLSISHVTFREYPNIEVPILSVEAFYPNASAEVCEYAVTNPLEEALSKVEGLDEMASQTRFQFVSISIRLKEGTSIDRTMLLMRDAISQVKGDLPHEVKEPVIKRNAERDSGPPFMAIMVASQSRSFGDIYHFATGQLKNIFQSIKGVAKVQIWGNPYDMKVSLDRKKMYTLGVNVDDITTALKSYNLAFPGGMVRDEIPVVMDLSLHSIQDFENLKIKSGEGGSLFLKDVAKVTMEEDRRSFRMRYQGSPAVIISISPSSDANVLDVSRLVKEEFERQKEEIPEDMELSLEIDQGDFIRASMSNVKSSILEAILLVGAIIFLFLGSLRASLIPILTIPISLIGAVTILFAFGYSLNVITLLAFVLAVGLVVDDAIVVLENIHRHIEEGDTPLMAAKKGSAEIGFAIIAMTMTLASVFIPIAFLKGFTGKLLVEFAVTLSGTVIISGITALTLSPLMCSRILKKHEKHRFPKVDLYIGITQSLYKKAFERIVQKPLWVGGVAVLVMILNTIFFSWMPSELAPKEDRNIMWAYTPQVPGKNIDTLDETVFALEEKLKNVEGVDKILVFMGDWGGSVVLQLAPSEKRKISANALSKQIQGTLVNFPSAEVYASSWDSGLPNLEIVESHAEFGVAVQTTENYKVLNRVMQGFRNKADESKKYKSAFFDLKFNLPSFVFDMNHYELGKLGILPVQVSETIQAYFSGIRYYEFYRDQVKYNVNIVAEDKPWNLSDLYITKPTGERVSLASIGTLRLTSVPKELKHYNQMRAAIFNGELLEGKTIQDAMHDFEGLKKELPKNMRTEWVGQAKIFSESSSDMMLLLILGVIFIFAILAIQFESFFDPLIILTTVPLASLGALFLLWMTGQSINIFTQVGLLTLIGLITKHGILLTEFANQKVREGHSILDAIKISTELRLRPIMMTTLAMVIGAVPLVLGGGAGCESRRAVGIALIGGLSLGTLMTLTLVPMFYMWIKNLQKRVLG